MKKIIAILILAIATIASAKVYNWDFPDGTTFHNCNDVDIESDEVTCDEGYVHIYVPYVDKRISRDDAERVNSSVYGEYELKINTFTVYRYGGNGWFLRYERVHIFFIDKPKFLGEYLQWEHYLKGVTISADGQRLLHKYCRNSTCFHSYWRNN